MAMGWVLLAIGAAAIAGAVAVLRTGGQGRRRAGAVSYRQRPRPERAERPYREAVHYRASGALPPWDP
jgi:hypothetical protein